MANPLGIAVITDSGKTLLANSLSGGNPVVPKYYRFSEDLVEAVSTMTAVDVPAHWKEKDIDLYQMVNSDTLELVMITEATEATNNVQTISVFLEDGTLFAVANPSYLMSKLQRQIAKLHLSYQDMGDALNFQYLAHDESDQDIALLNTIVTQGRQITENTLTIKQVKFQGVN